MSTQSDIDRVAGPFANRSRVVVQRFPGGGGQVWALATARDKTLDVAGQTRDLLDVIGRYLRDAGTDPSRLLRAEVFLLDMAQKESFDAAWTDWLPAGCGPVRSAVQTPMPPGDLVEVIVTAALPCADAR
jgi:enamine deaminase RidA (YjgF/YER057c/UK114 family)